MERIHVLHELEDGTYISRTHGNKVIKSLDDFEDINDDVQEKLDVLELAIGGSMDAIDNKEPLAFFGSAIEYGTIDGIWSYVIALVVGILQ